MIQVGSSLLIEFPKISDSRGDLTVIEHQHHVPFDISRVYYLYNVPEKQARGFHAHRELSQVFIAINGSFEVVLDDGCRRETIALDRPDQGLLVGRMVWHEMCNFSSGSICLVLASMAYNELDYIRDYEQFLSLIQQARR